MDELKKPYKITLWEDKPRYIYNQQNEVTNQWLEEVCIATIGSNTMDTPIRAFNPILTEDLNGSKTFTFTTYYRYWDDEAEEFKINPFTNLLVNERKVKLKYGDDWYDFVIKQVQENSNCGCISDFHTPEMHCFLYSRGFPAALSSKDWCIRKMPAFQYSSKRWKATHCAESCNY